MERLFLAIDFPSHIKEEIFDFYRKYLEQDIKGIRWVKKQNIHITLKFFGDTSQEKKSVLIRSVSEVCNKFLPFDMCIEKAGVFPNNKNPGIIWLGVRDAGGNIFKIQKLIENNLFSQGFDREEKKFIPHLTIARINYKNNNIMNLVREFLLASLKTSDFVIEGLVLFKSLLYKEGVIYEPLQYVGFNEAKDT